MTTPMATEITRRLESVARDSFLDHLPTVAAQADAGPQAVTAPSPLPRGRRA